MAPQEGIKDSLISLFIIVIFTIQTHISRLKNGYLTLATWFISLFVCACFSLSNCPSLHNCWDQLQFRHIAYKRNCAEGRCRTIYKEVDFIFSFILLKNLDILHFQNTPLKGTDNNLVPDVCRKLIGLAHGGDVGCRLFGCGQVVFLYR